MIKKKQIMSFEINYGGKVKGNLNTFPSLFLVHHEQQERNKSVFTQRKKAASSRHFR